MRKFISIFLALVMCASLVVPAFAASADTTIDNPVCFEYSENGMFKPINDASRMRSSKNIISTTPTENPDVFHVEENNYLVRSYDDNYVMSLRYPIDAEHFDTQNYQDVPPEVLERVAAEIREQQLIGNNEFTVDIYGPAESTTRDGWGGVYPYGPYFLKDWFVDLKYAHTDMVEKKGSKAIDYADMLKEIIIETIKDDMIEEINLPIFEKGITALDHILKVAGIEKLSQLSSNDYIKTDTVFHKMGKSVYVLDGSTWKPQH